MIIESLETNLILVLQSLVQLSVPVGSPCLQVGESILLNLSYDLSDFLQYIFPLDLVSEEVRVHQEEDLLSHLFVEGG